MGLVGRIFSKSAGAFLACALLASTMANAKPLTPEKVHARAKNLMRAGTDEVRAWRSATNQRGPWWNGGASHMNAAYPKSWFDRMGLVSLLEVRQRLTSAS